MKKKLLMLALMLTLLVCAFAISVSAVTITYEGEEIELVNNLGDPSWYTGTVAEKITDKDSIVILKDSTKLHFLPTTFSVLRLMETIFTLTLQATQRIRDLTTRLSMKIKKHSIQTVAFTMRSFQVA